MYNTDMPTRAELPSSAQLVRSTVIAAGVAAADGAGAAGLLKRGANTQTAATARNTRAAVSRRVQ